MVADNSQSEQRLTLASIKPSRTVPVFGRRRATSGSHPARHTSRFAAEVTGWKDTFMDRPAAPCPAERCRENPRDRSPAGADVEDGESGIARAVVGWTLSFRACRRRGDGKATWARPRDHEGRPWAGFSDGSPLGGVSKE